MFSLCICCRRNTKGDDDGIVNPSVQTNAEHADSGPVQFRNGFAKKAGERHSHPANTTQNGALSTRISAPGRALPQLPGDTYAAIDKSRKNSIRFVDDVANPMYESIDPDADSFIDPLYSKVGEPISTRRDRKYDYPVFHGKRNEPGTSRQNEEMYQSASQIYGGSEDPYRVRHTVKIYRIPVPPPKVSVAHYFGSITSASRAAGAGEFGEEDSSSAYDPGYAKVKPTQLDARRLERIEKRENEVDRLYSKIRRDARDPDEDNGPRPVIDLGEPRVPVEPVFFQQPQAGGVERPDSREPSYRYITVRENADRVRERLREQGQLGGFNREHYYSTIGNEYDTIQLDTSSNTYAAPVANGLSPPGHMGGLSVSTSSSSAAPPPPTSPIPHREASPERTVPAYSTVNKRRNTEGQAVSCSGPLGDWNAPSQGIATSFAGLNRSFTGTVSSRDGQLSPSAVASATIPGIKEFMQKPVLPYNSAETVLGRRVVEERERIVEQRMSQSTGPVLDGLPTNERVHRVEITRLNSVDGPSADTIISGRRYRSNTNTGETATVVEVSDASHSSRSHLPVSVNRAETSRVSDVSHQRRQLGSEGPTPSTAPSSSDKADKSGRKRATDGAGNSLASSIYTAKDYVSTMDMGNERPWPISREPSPSARSEKRKD